MSILQSGTPNYLKIINKRKVLQEIIDGAELYSRASLAKKLKLSKPTISALVDELVEEGWVTEKESKEAAKKGGRKPVHLLFDKEYKYTIGIDIGGTTTEIAIMDLDGAFILHRKIDTQAGLKKDFILLLVNEINAMLEAKKINQEKVLGLAIGAPGITDSDQGIVIEAPSLGWLHYPLKNEIAEHFPFPIYIENDVNMAVLGECWKGAAKAKSHVVLITIGTGVGCGIVINGELFRGGQYAAGEIGYMITNKDQASQGFESMFKGYGFLENLVGGPSIVKQYQRGSDKEDYSAEKIFEKAMEGEALANSIINEALDHLAVSLINVAALLNPECIVLGGGISKSGYWFLPKLQEKLELYLPEQSRTEIMLTKLPQASLLGATVLCMKKHALLPS
ncbi:ROK family transcriptional regulator [Niallia sp.]|uniref:ROK family transcriptional regulator n=1 Tax=Niallia sp. TaxID=2837523 RepID=UPI0028A1992E|nr:ROK family transcriptional regulator [Niallia sp.]